ncbi:MAG: hypothetical protein IJG40_16120 [Oscillospiraceae bacterium]|nr:hypothetical protein [Oscillospiraceae bacterium]
MESMMIYVLQLEALLDSASRYYEGNDAEKAEALVSLAEDVLQDLKSEVFIESKGE